MARQSTTPTCPHCGAPVKDTPLCPDAEQTLHALLRRLVSTVPTVLRFHDGTPLTDTAGRQPSSRWDTPAGEQGAMPRLLAEAVGRQARFAPQAEKVDTGKAAARVMLPSKAGDRATRLHAVVVRAANDLIAAQMCVMALPLAVETTTAAEWLLDGFARLRLHPAAPDLLAELQRAVDGAEKAIDRPPDRHYLGPCDLNQTACQGEVHVIGDRPSVCPICGRYVDPTERRNELAVRARELWLTAREIDNLSASLHGPAGRIPKSNITSWYARSLIRGIQGRPGEDEDEPLTDEAREKAARRPTRFLYGEVVDQAARIPHRASRKTS